MQVAESVAQQMTDGDQRIFGVMVESHLNEGRQDHAPGCVLEYGKSITDACLGWADSLVLLEKLAQGVRERRKKHDGNGEE